MSLCDNNNHKRDTVLKASLLTDQELEVFLSSLDLEYPDLERWVDELLEEKPMLKDLNTGGK